MFQRSPYNFQQKKKENNHCVVPIHALLESQNKYFCTNINKSMLQF